MKIVFFGSSDFARPALRILVEAGYAPALVVTKPDAPHGRGKKIYDAEVKLEAVALGLPCEQPADANAPEFVARLRALAPDVGAVVSYGVLMRPELFSLPARGCLNAHASLLPLYRGAAPIQHCIREGRIETGISIMRIEEQLDAGPVMLQEKTAIGERENAGALRERLAEMAGRTLVKALQLVEAGKDKWTPQDHAKATWARALLKPDGVIGWQKPASEIDLLVRAMTPKPGAQTRLHARRFIVLDGEVEADLYGAGVSGLIMTAGEEGIRVCTGKDLYRITRIKPENGRTMTAGEWVRGHTVPPDARFG